MPQLSTKPWLFSKKIHKNGQKRLTKLYFDVKMRALSIFNNECWKAPKGKV
jgi:hypothetical protein